MGQKAKPNTDIDNAGNWLDTVYGDGDTILFDELDEDVTDNLTTAVHKADPKDSGNSFEVGLTTTTDPLVSDRHKINVTASGKVQRALQAILKQGVTIKSANAFFKLTPTMQNFVYNLLASEADSITNYSDLRMQMKPWAYLDHGTDSQVGTPSWNDLHGDTGLVAYYKYNEASGDVINKSLAAEKIANSDLVVNGATYGVPGIIDDALSFDSVNDDLSANNTSAIDWRFFSENNAKWTITMWYKIDNFSANNDILATTQHSGGDTGNLIRFLTNRKILIACGHSGDDRITHTTTLLTPNDTNFHFLYMSYDDAAGELLINIDNGTRESSTGHNLTNTITPEFPLHIGSDTGSIFFGGDIDETAIFDGRILDTTEEGDMYNGGVGREIY